VVVSAAAASAAAAGVAERAAQRHASGAGHRSQSTSRYGVRWRTSAEHMPLQHREPHCSPH
jgi:hypothetical protein